MASLAHNPKESDIVYESGDYWVLKSKGGFKVFKTGITHSQGMYVVPTLEQAKDLIQAHQNSGARKGKRNPLSTAPFLVHIGNHTSDSFYDRKQALSYGLREVAVMMAAGFEIEDGQGNRVEYGRDGKVLSRELSRANPKVPAEMSAAEINKLLDRLDAESSKLTDEFIAAGRGNERPSEYLRMTDPLALKAQSLYDRQSDLRNEVERRAGPGMRRLPKGFGPMRQNPPRQKYLDRGIQLSSTPPDKYDGLNGPFRFVIEGTPVTVLKKGRGQRTLISTDYEGQTYYGWVDMDRLSASKQNPAPESAALFESFHGTPSTTEEILVEEERYHGNLAELGVLVSLTVETVAGDEVKLGFADPDGESEENPSSERVGPYLKKGQEFTFKGQTYVVDHFARTPWEDANYTYVVHKPGSDQKYIAWVYSEDRGHAYAGKVFAISKGEHSHLQNPPKGPFGRASQFAESALDSAQSLLTQRGPLGAAYKAGKKVGEYLDGRLGKVMSNPKDGWLVGLDTGVNRPVQIVNTFKTRKAAEDFARETRDRGNTGYSVMSASEYHRRAKAYLDFVRRGIVKNPHHSAPGPVLLCSNESGTQLYFMGGDQSLDLSQLKIPTRDLAEIGTVTQIEYHTKKYWDGTGKKPEIATYYHKFGEEVKSKRDRPLPVLIYDSLNEKLSLAGGDYRIEQPMIGLSPGLMN